jgi:hypothetical protein
MLSLTPLATQPLTTVLADPKGGRFWGQGGSILGAGGLRRRIGTFYLLAQKLVLHNSDLNKSTTVCKVGTQRRPF